MEGNNVFIGNSTIFGVDLQVDKFGFQFKQLTIESGSHGYIGIKNDSLIDNGGEDYFVNIELIEIKGDLIIQYYFKSNGLKNTTISIYNGGEFVIDSSNEFQCFMINGLQKSKINIQSGSNVELFGLTSLSSIITIKESNLIIFDNEKDKSTLFNSTSTINIINSNFTIYNTLNLLDNSVLTFNNSNVSFKDGDNGNGDSIIVTSSSMYIDNGSNYYSEQFTLIESSSIFIDSSTGLINNDYQLYGEGSLLSIKNSNFQINNTLILMDDSKVHINSNSKVLIYGSILVNGTSSLLVQTNSEFTIKSKSLDETLYFQIMDDAKLSFIENSIVSLESNLKIGERASILINKSNVSFNSRVSFLNESILSISNSSSIIINDNLLIQDNSFMELKESELTIIGSITLKNNSYLSSKQSSVIINGHLSLIEHYIEIIDSSFKINGLFYIENGSNIKLQNSTIENNNQVIIDGGSLVSLSTSNTSLEYFNNNNGGNLEINSLNINSTTTTTTSTTNIKIPILNNNNGTIKFNTNKFNLLSIKSNGGILILNHNSINSNLSVISDLESINDQFIFTINGNEVNNNSGIESTFINILNNTIINNSTITIRISIDLINTKQNITLIKSNSNILGDNSITKIIYKSYNQSTGIENELNSCPHTIVINNGTLRLQFNNNIEICKSNSNSNSNSLSDGKIAGIVIAVMVVALLIGLTVFLKSKLPKVDGLSFKLKSLIRKKNQEN